MSQEVSDFSFNLYRPSGLQIILHEAFSEHDDKADLRKVYQEKMLYKLDGQAANRIVDALWNRMKNCLEGGFLFMLFGKLTLHATSMATRVD